jgi:hypothetical protein
LVAIVQNTITVFINEMPSASLNCLPSPLVELRRQARIQDGPKILFQRDDLTGLGLGAKPLCPDSPVSIRDQANRWREHTGFACDELAC